MICSRGTLAVLVSVLGVSLVSTGCLWRKAKASPRPAVTTLPPAPESKPEPLPAPPEVESGESVSSLPPSPIETPIEPPKPLEQPKPPRATPRPAAQAPPPLPQQETPAPEIPQLVPLLTPAEQERYTREIGDFIKRAEDNLARIGARKLDPRQRDNVLRARTFIRQALDLRQSDLLTARSLAQRADVLAQDVASTLR